MQADAPKSSVYFPTGQVLQVALAVAPRTAEKLPGRHERQVPLLVAAMVKDHVPAAQGLHEAGASAEVWPITAGELVEPAEQPAVPY